jgi:hypothetical protein
MFVGNASLRGIGLGYAHGDPIYNAAGQFVGNFIQGMTDADVAALLATPLDSGASFGGTNANQPVSPVYVAAPAPAAQQASARQSTNPALRDWIAANVNQPKLIYNRLFLTEGLNVSQIDDVMAYPQGKDYGIAYINQYLVSNGIDPARPGAIKAALTPYASNPLANADKVYALVAQNGISYVELAALMGWDKTQSDAILLKGARMLGYVSSSGASSGTQSGGSADSSSFGGGTVNPGGSANFNESTGVTFDEGSMADDYTMPILLGIAALGGIALFRGTKRGGK